MAAISSRLNQDNNPGNARWCGAEGHKRLECTKQRSRGRGQCHGPAIRGTDRCKTHSGTSPRTAAILGKAEITAWSAIGMPAKENNVEAGMAVVNMLNQAWLRASVYGELLRRQVAVEGEALPAEPVYPVGDAEDTSGLIGHKYGMGGKEGILYRQSEEVRALVGLEAAERDRVVKYAKTAHDMGISDRLTALSERWGDVVVTRIMTVLDNLDLTIDQQRRVPALIQMYLGTIDLSAIGEGGK